VKDAVIYGLYLDSNGEAIKSQAHAAMKETLKNAKSCFKSLKPLDDNKLIVNIQ